MKVGDRVLITAEITEIRHNGTVIVRATSGDYFGVGKSSVVPDERNANESHAASIYEDIVLG